MDESRVARVGEGIGEETLAALLEASATINASLEPSETLQTIARVAATVLGAEGSSVLLLDKRRNKLIFQAAVGDRSDILIGDVYNRLLRFETFVFTDLDFGFHGDHRFKNKAFLANRNNIKANLILNILIAGFFNGAV